MIKSQSISHRLKNLVLCALLSVGVLNAHGAAKTPNIVVIMTDDVAPMDISAIHRGLGAVETPNIDRIAKEGLIVSDFYAQPSCTAGRAAFITGQYPIRTGLTSVGQPGSPVGLSAEDVTVAELLKARGYATAQFGKSHVGDRNEHLPTVHGFDEFFGLLYHLNMMEMFEQPEFPKDPNFVGRPRNVLYTRASEKDDETVMPRFGKVGKQTIEDKGTLGAKRQETFDDEVLAASQDWLKRTKKTGKPFFLWFAPAAMHQQIHVPPEFQGKSGHSLYADGLLHLDAIVGKLLKELDDQGLTDNTIVLFTSDNGVNLAHWPSAGTASFRGEKGTTWDGGFRVPMFVRWPGHVAPNTWTGEFMTMEDWLPTLMSAVGDPSVKENLKAGTKVGERDYKVHLDGYDQTAMLTGKGKSLRHEFFFYGENDFNAMRVDQWKMHLALKNSWLGAREVLDGGLTIDIKLDPFERTPETGGHLLWMKEKSYIIPMVMPYLAKFQKSMQEFPPRQKGSGIGAATMGVPKK
ncbi:MAG: arylsulfatase [Rhodocyclaceae bacterium]|nr:arylsulfatase [Rhodocyclaceae bacterium]